MTRALKTTLLVLILSAFMAVPAWAAYVNDEIEDADLMTWTEDYDSGTETITAITDPAGPGVRYEVSTTATSGFVKIAISDDYAVADIYGFPVTGGFADWTGYTAYRLRFTNNSPSGWVDLKAYFTTRTFGDWNSSSDVWLAPGQSVVCSIDLAGIPYLNQVGNFGFELGSNIGTGDYEAEGFDVTVTSLGLGSVSVDPSPLNSGPISCIGLQTLDFMYTPESDAPALRGYSIEVECSSELSFVHNPPVFTDIRVHDPSGESSSTQIVENGPNHYTIDYVILGSSINGITGPDSLFSIDFHGASTGDGSVTLVSAVFRDLDNGAIVSSLGGPARTVVDCTAPNTPLMTAEPTYTQGTSNMVAWSSESASGAVEYYVEAATASDFSGVVGNSGWITGLSQTFTNLTDGQIYYYHVKARDTVHNESGWSGAVSSTQDATAPATSAGPLGAYQNTLIFDVPFSVTETGSGLDYVELFVDVDGGGYNSVGTYASSPISFTASGDGFYSFYTVGTDDVGNVEAPPGSADATTTVDTAAPNVPTMTAELPYTPGLENTVDWSDESGSGAVAYWAQCASDAGFGTVVAESGWIAGTSHTFTTLTDGSTYWYRVKAKDGLDNESIYSAAVSSTQDDTAPATSAGPLDPYQTTLSFDVPFSVTETGSGFVSVELFVDIDGGGYSSVGTYASSPIAYTASGGGIYSFYTTGTDAVGNVETAPGTADAVTTVDAISPGPVTNIAASPAHQQVTVDWAYTGEALDSLIIFYADWEDGLGGSAYPEYDDLPGDVIPTRPTGYPPGAEWTKAGSVVGSATSFTHTFSSSMRGVYYYEVFSRDLAGNHSAPAAANDRTANYILGDIFGSYDGAVHIDDITVLGDAYGTFDGDGSGDYNNEADVGPTDDASGTGIPLTDSNVQFEDLMIFALNYTTPGPLSPVEGTDIARLSWYQLEDGSWALALVEPCANLKALQLTATLPTGYEPVLTGGSMLTQQAGPVFLRQIPGEGLDISLALMGNGLVLQGQGILFTVTLPAGVQPGAPTLLVRDVANTALDFELSATGVEELPTAYRLAGNFPNPFNPKTSIAFDLPEAQDVQLLVFSADGRRVATLLNERVPAGRHVAVWNGRDTNNLPVASGVYFCRIDAGPLQETRKMLLMK